MSYCLKCGAKIVEGAKFCQKCGTAVHEDVYANEAKRQQEYVGKIYKCPNCGEVLNSFVRNCPSCGFELRGAKGASFGLNILILVETRAFLGLQSCHLMASGIPVLLISDTLESRSDSGELALIRF